MGEDKIRVRSDKGRREYYFKSKSVKSWEDLQKTKPLIERFFRHGRKRGRKYSDKTVYQYGSIFEDFFKIVHKEYDEITFEDVERYADGLEEKGIMEITIGNRLATIQRFFNWLISPMGVVKENPVKIEIGGDVENNIFLKKMREIPTRKEFRKMLETTQHPRDYCILNLLYNFGMRVGELCNLKLTDLDAEKWTLTIGGKGDTVRIISIPAKVVTALQNWLRYREGVITREDYLILSRHGLKLKSDFVRQLIQRACERAGISKHITPHSLRRMFFTNGIEDGIPPKVLQFIAGQKTSIMIDRYTQFTQMNFDFSTAWKGLDKVEIEQ
jgi:integrase/recombinase XerD